MEADFAEANYYRLSGEDARITYQLTRRGEQIHYKGSLDDDQRDLTFKGAKRQIESLESNIGKILTVELNPE